MVDSWKLEFGADAPTTAGEAVQGLIDQGMSARMSANQRAAAAWHRANGDRERRHTTGVFLKKSRVAGGAPVLGVYVDSHAIATDFSVNKDIYLARLANIGFQVSGIQFLPSRKGYRPATVAHDERAHNAPTPLPALSEEELKRVDQLVAQLPDTLRASASKAIALSMRRQKLENAQNQKQS